MIRADAFADLGGGHIMRCLSLARWLATHDCHVAFACAPGSADLVPALARSGFPVLDAHGNRDLPLPEGWPARADAVFVDLYSSNASDEAALRDKAGAVAAIEDLDGRHHDCDLLVDPGAGRSENLYRGRVPADCRVLAGPGFALLRDEFAAARVDSLAHRAKPTAPPRRALISMGLTDLGGISEHIVRAVIKALPDVAVEVILGPRAPSLPALRTLAAYLPRLELGIDVDDMARRMSHADIAIGAGGGTALERCALGLPSIAIILAANQRSATLFLARTGALLAVDTNENVENMLPGLLARMTPELCSTLSMNAALVCDGQGTERVGRALLKLVNGNRPEVRNDD